MDMLIKTYFHRGAAHVLLALALAAACGDSGSGGTADDSSGASESSAASSGETSAASSGETSGAPPMACDGADEHAGEGTYYGADGSGNCSFPPSPDDLMVAAMNHTDYGDAAACGACVRAAGPAGEVTVRIVDRCPECAPGDIDFSQQAFEQIAELSAGRVPITWRYVPCATSGPVRYHFKEGSNEFWSAIQVRNHRHAIASLEYSPDGASWTPMARESYNYFLEPSGMGPGPYTLRVTDVEGGVVVDEGVPFAPDTEVDGAAQLPACE